MGVALGEAFVGVKTRDREGLGEGGCEGAALDDVDQQQPKEEREVEARIQHLRCYCRI